jgi:hypothetical protein
MTARPRGCRLDAPGPGRALLILFASLVAVSPASAQVFRIQGGSSSLFAAHGASIELKGQRTSLSIGGGRLGQDVTIGFLGRKSVRGAIFSVGDEAVDFQLPTDIFGGSRYVSVRNAGVDVTRGRTHVRVLAGTTAATGGAPYFRGARWGAPISVLFVDREVTARLALFSRTAIAGRATSIHGLSWKPRASLGLAASGGIGANRPYVALGATSERRWVALNVAFVEQQPGFSRIAADDPLSAEPDRGNISLTVRPTSWWNATVARHTLLDTVITTPIARTTVEHVGTSVNAAGFRVIGTIYDARGPRGHTDATSFTVGRRVYRSLDGTIEYFTSRADGEAATHSLVARLEHDISARLSVLHTVTRSASQTSFNVGGEFISNLVHVAVTHQTIYAPLKPGDPFVQAVGVDLRVHLIGDIALQGGTYLTPDGRQRYTISATRVHARSAGSQPNSGGSKIERYLVRGRVRDVYGTPVAGAVVRVGGEVLITDDEGRFFRRVARSRRLSLEVATDEFLTAGRFHVVSSPSWITPGLDEHGTEAIVLVSRV